MHGMIPFPVSTTEPARCPPNSGASAATGVTNVKVTLVVTVALAVVEPPAHLHHLLREFDGMH